MIERARRISILLAPLWAVGVTAYILFGPMIRSAGVTASLARGGAGETVAVQRATSSWYDHFGLEPLKFLLIPVGVSLLPLFARGPRSRRVLVVGSTAVLAGFCALSIFSIGSFYLPGAGALFVAAVLEFA